MRCSSIVALLVVTASFALGGCAADAEPATGTDNASTALEETDGRRAGDVHEGVKVGDLRAEAKTRPLDADKAREALRVSDVTGDPRLEVFPSPFGRVPTEKLGPVPSIVPQHRHEGAVDVRIPSLAPSNPYEEAAGIAIPSLRPMNPYEEAVEVDNGLHPFSGNDKP